MKRHQEMVKWERKDRLWALYTTTRKLIEDGFEPADVLCFALQGIGPGTMQQGVPMILGKALPAGLMACSDFDFRSDEEKEQDREWAEEEAERVTAKANA